MEIQRRDVLRAVGGLTATAALASAGVSAAPGDPDDPYLKYVHPDLREGARGILARIPSEPPLTTQNLPLWRDAMSRYYLPPLPDVPHASRTVPGLAAQGPVPIQLVNVRRGGAPRPAILHTHGGGFIMGRASGAVHDLQEVCRALDCVGISVEYRLAPEARYRDSLEDNYAALKWLHDHAGELGVDPRRIALMGESAGGGHAALLAIAARDRGEVPVSFQCLTYPMLDDRTGTSRPVLPHVGKLIWTADSNRFGWTAFLGAPAGSDAVPAAGVPARLTEFAGLPPAFIGVGTLDLFCAEDMAYAARLNAAGVAAELIVVPGAYHGFDGFAASTPVSRWFASARLTALRRALA